MRTRCARSSRRKSRNGRKSPPKSACRASTIEPSPPTCAENMKTILLPFYDDDVSRRAFELAARIARPVGGYVEGLFVLRRPQILDGSEGDMLADSHFAELEDECRHAAARARTRFEACAAAQ